MSRKDVRRGSAASSTSHVMNLAGSVAGIEKSEESEGTEESEEPAVIDK